MKTKLFLLLLPLFMLACSSSDDSTDPITQASGTIYVNNQVMEFNKITSVARNSDVLIIEIDQANSGYSFTLQFTEKSGNITNSCIYAGIANFNSADTYIYSGNVVIENYDKARASMYIKFDNVEFRDKKNLSKSLSLNGAIEFPVKNK